MFGCSFMHAKEMYRSDGSLTSSLRWPDLFVLGLSKTGTSTLHDCLTSDAFGGEACCAGAKELRLFRFPRSLEPSPSEVLRMHAQLQARWRGRKRGGSSRRLRRKPWPTRDQPRGPGSHAYSHVLDFTPGYVSDANAATAMRRLYDEALREQLPDERRLRFVVVLRDVAARTRSHFCMAARNLKQLDGILRTPTVCRRYPG